jgi:hypothetical protein
LNEQFSMCSPSAMKSQLTVQAVKPRFDSAPCIIPQGKAKSLIAAVRAYSSSEGKRASHLKLKSFKTKTPRWFLEQVKAKTKKKEERQRVKKRKRGNEKRLASKKMNQRENVSECKQPTTSSHFIRSINQQTTDHSRL